MHSRMGTTLVSGINDIASGERSGAAAPPEMLRDQRVIAFCGRGGAAQSNFDYRSADSCRQARMRHVGEQYWRSARLTLWAQTNSAAR